MRQRFALDTANPSQPVNLDFIAQAITVYNPTPNVVAVRIGGNSLPTSPITAEIFVAPYTAQTYPVDTVSYGLALLPLRGTVLDEDVLLPQKALVTFTRDEPPPYYAAVDLSGSATQDEMIVDQGSRAAGAYVDGPFTVPAYARTIIIRNLGLSHNFFYVRALPSGRQVLTLVNSTAQEAADNARLEWLVPWWASTETEFEVESDSGGVLNNYEIRVSRNAYEPQTRHDDHGRQQVGVIPEGLLALPVDLASFSGGPVTVAVTPNPLPVTARPPARAVTELAASAIRGATGTYGPVNSDGARGIRFFLTVTVVPGVVSITPNLRALNPLRANTYDIATAPAAITTVGTRILEYYPGADAAVAGATVTRQAIRLPTDCYLLVTHSGAGNFTYSIDYELLD